VTFPAGLTTIEVTGQNLRDFGGAPANGVVIFTASEVVADPAAELVVAGSTEGVVTNGVMATVTLPTTDAVTPAFTYTVTLRLQNADESPPAYTGVSVPHTLGATVDLSTLLAGA
jgi:hypothetical protein